MMHVNIECTMMGHLPSNITSYRMLLTKDEQLGKGAKRRVTQPLL